jgi:hypothetical protein
MEDYERIQAFLRNSQPVQGGEAAAAPAILYDRRVAV